MPASHSVRPDVPGQVKHKPGSLDDVPYAYYFNVYRGFGRFMEQTAGPILEEQHLHYARGPQPKYTWEQKEEARSKTVLLGRRFLHADQYEALPEEERRKLYLDGVANLIKVADAEVRLRNSFIRPTGVLS